jgi:hypothetical protein
MTNLAESYSQLGEFQCVKELMTRALEKRTEILGQDHPYTLLCIDKLAATYCNLGDFASGQQLQTTTLKKQMDSLGVDHQIFWIQWAISRRFIINLANAEHMFLANLIRRSRTDHNRTHILGRMCNLAKVYVRKPILEEAAILQETGTEDLTRILNRNHSHVTLQLRAAWRWQKDSAWTLQAEWKHPTHYARTIL